MFSALLIPFPDIDPVLVEIGSLAIRWYALAYMAGILLGYYHIRQINQALAVPVLSKKQLEDLILWAVVGILLGGRLGYTLFYKPDYYLANPSEILMVWQGGMAFHGGLLGVIVAFYAFARTQKLNYLRLMDLVACAAPIGLFFGRVANFINGELYGRATDVSWAMIFPHGGDVPRHPSQLYQAGLEGLALFVLLWLLRTRTSLGSRPGGLAGVFLIGYGLARGFVEFFRAPDAHLGLLWLDLSMGQLLCLPMIAIGLYLLFTSRKHHP